MLNSPGNISYLNAEKLVEKLIDDDSVNVSQ